MGIVLKRRDNADILKHVYGGVMDIIMNEKNIKKSKKKIFSQKHFIIYLPTLTKVPKFQSAYSQKQFEQ